MHNSYNKYEVIYLAEFCLDCWNKINGTNDPPENYVISKELALCEGCRQMKQVIVIKRTGNMDRSYRIALWILLICVLLYILFQRNWS